MWKYVCLCKGLFLITFVTNIWGLNIGYPRTREQIYIDVLKNITYVKNIINDLLKNYKQLKTDYEAKAKLQNELSIETEFDGDFKKQASHVRYKTIKNNEEEDFHPVTQMILLDEEFQYDNSGVESNGPGNTNEEIQPSSVENIKKDKLNANNIHDTREQFESPIGNIKIDAINAKKKVDTDMIDNLKHDSLFKNLIKKKKQPEINHLNKPEMTIIGTALKYMEKTLPNLDIKDKEKPKTIFDKSNFEKEYLTKNKVIDQNIKPILRIGFNNDKNMRNNENVDITDYTSMYDDTLKKWETIHDYLEKMYFKKNTRPNPKVTLVLVRHNNKGQKEHVIKNNFEVTSVNSVEKMTRDQLKTKILRDAYGDACLKVALRKCYKTLLEVRKIVCGMDFKCRDSFKEHFKLHSKTGCIKEFNYHGKQENETIDKSYYKVGNNVDVESKYDDVFQDIGRSSTNINYYDLCLPVMMSGVKTDSNQKRIRKELVRDLNKTEPINILRDRYERECRRMSREKCEAACQYAVSMTCDQSLCVHREKRTFSRTCRRQCKQAFLPNGHSDSYSDSDSSSDSDDSDSDSISSW